MIAALSLAAALAFPPGAETIVVSADSWPERQRVHDCKQPGRDIGGHASISHGMTSTRKAPRFNASAAASGRAADARRDLGCCG